VLAFDLSESGCVVTYSSSFRLTLTCKIQTLPKYKNGDGRSSSMLPLYPVSAGVSYPNAKEVLTFLTKSKITETLFSEEHVEMLLNVLVLDGDIERVR